MSTARESKRTHLDRSRQHLASNDPARIRYAALELRLCLEIMTREKLNSYAKYLPQSFATNTWQPPKQLKVMRQVAANADKSFELYAGPEAVPGAEPSPDAFRLIGKHNAFSVEWLSKNYNKLGSFVHARFEPMTAIDEASALAYLVGIAGEIASAQEGNILGMCMVQPITFQCALCEQAIAVSERFARDQPIVSCHNEKCEAEYRPEIGPDGARFHLLAQRIRCVKCEAEMVVQDRHSGIRRDFQCPACKSKFLIVGLQYSPLDT